eukprot:13096434-Alexandrium_andersonii.AAC.1
MAGQRLAGGDQTDQPAGGQFNPTAACNTATVPSGHILPVEQDFSSGPLSAALLKDDTWFIRVGRGGLVHLKGAGEAAAAQFPADAWARICG